MRQPGLSICRRPELQNTWGTEMFAAECALTCTFHQVYISHVCNGVSLESFVLCELTLPCQRAVPLLARSAAGREASLLHNLLG